MALAERLSQILQGLPRGWEAARVSVTVEDESQAERVGLILAPATPGRTGASFHLHIRRAEEGAGASPELAQRVLARLDRDGIAARLVLVGAESSAAPTAPAAEQPGLAAAWEELLGRLPPDWSDLYVELELDSSDFLERGALLLAPVNPARYGGPSAFRFRSARRFGYGVAPEMARRCLERLDHERITGEVRVLRVLSGTSPVSTQGPVWRVGGRSV